MMTKRSVMKLAVVAVLLVPTAGGCGLFDSDDDRDRDRIEDRNDRYDRDGRGSDRISSGPRDDGRSTEDRYDRDRDRDRY